MSAERDRRRTILHVDLDAFYASVHQRDDAALRGKPVIVGGESKRGVVSAASYEARPFGVRSAMPMVEALRRCPHAVVVTPDFPRYQEASRRVFSIFARYTPLVEGLSLDEAFLDVTASRSLFGDGETIARRIKEEIKNEVQLIASAGVAASKFAAKIASDLRKPDALVVVPEEVASFLAPLPIERMWGLGPKSSEVVRRAGYRTLGDLARADRKHLARVLGDFSAHIIALANGIDDRDVDPNREAKSVGSEQTFETDLVAREEMERALLAQASRVAERLVADGIASRGLSIKIKYADFKVVTRQMKLPEAVADTMHLYRAACELLSRVPLEGARVRLVGVTAHDLVEHGAEPSLFPDERIVRNHKLEQAALTLREKFGEKTVTRATLLEAEERAHVDPERG